MNTFISIFKVPLRIFFKAVQGGWTPEDQGQESKGQSAK